MKITKKSVGAWGAAALLVATFTGGCGTTGSTPAPHAADARGGRQAAAQADSGLSGSQLWGQMCGLCHNAPSPKDHSDMQWEVIVMHMRVQARLTGEEERKIVQFLKASN
jgi:cytochrome c5